MRDPSKNGEQETVAAKRYGRFLLSPDGDDRDQRRHSAARRYKIRLPLIPADRGGVRLGRVSVARADRAGVLAHLRAWLDARSGDLQALDHQGEGDGNSLEASDASAEVAHQRDQWRAVEGAVRELEAEDRGLGLDHDSPGGSFRAETADHDAAGPARPQAL